MAKTVAEALWMNKVASLGCVICRKVYGKYVPCEIHHVAEGSGVRSDFSIAPLCKEHHTGASGFHKRGKLFLKQFRVPGESEYGLLVMVNEQIAEGMR